MYIYTIHYLHSIESSIGKRSRGRETYIQEFIRNFGSLFEINDIQTLLNKQNGLISQLGNVNFSYKLNSSDPNQNMALHHYDTIIREYLDNITSGHPYYEYKTFFKDILDGLLLAVLLFLSNRIIENKDTSILFCSFQSMLELDKKKEFVDFLLGFYRANNEIFDMYKHPLMFVLSGNSNIENYYSVVSAARRGGKKQFIDKMEINLTNTYNAYKELFKTYKNNRVEFKRIDIKGGNGLKKIKKQLKKYK